MAETLGSCVMHTAVCGGHTDSRSPPWTPHGFLLQLLDGFFSLLVFSSFSPFYDVVAYTVRYCTSAHGALSAGDLVT